jgi:hypothetical protein
MCRASPILFSTTQNASWPRTHIRSRDLNEIIQAFYDGFRHKPGTTFGKVRAGVLADKVPDFRPMKFCSVIRGSA